MFRDVTGAFKDSGSVKGESEQWLALLQEQVRTLRFGVVQLVVHEGRVVQIERTEKVRLDKEQSHKDNTH